MPPGAVPQLYLKCHGAHACGVIKDVSSTISGRGLSIAATQKIALGPQFALLMRSRPRRHAPPRVPRRPRARRAQVHLVPGGGRLDGASARGGPEDGRRFGRGRRGPRSRRRGARRVRPPASRGIRAGVRSSPNGAPRPNLQAERYLSVECSQRPGLILAITELLYQQGCLIPKIETTTFVAARVRPFSCVGQRALPPPPIAVQGRRRPLPHGRDGPGDRRRRRDHRAAPRSAPAPVCGPSFFTISGGRIARHRIRQRGPRHPLRRRRQLLSGLLSGCRAGDRRRRRRTTSLG